MKVVTATRVIEQADGVALERVEFFLAPDHLDVDAIREMAEKEGWEVICVSTWKDRIESWTKIAQTGKIEDEVEEVYTRELEVEEGNEKVKVEVIVIRGKSGNEYILGRVPQSFRAFLRSNVRKFQEKYGKLERGTRFTARVDPVKGKLRIDL